MSQASQQVSRYRPAVIAITGVAAAFGIWTLYSTFSGHSAKAPLHRSNAVRQVRRVSAEEPLVEYTGPTLDEPFGAVVVKRNNLPVGRIVFGRDIIPSPEEWQTLHGDDAEHARSRIIGIAVGSVVSATHERPSDLTEEARQLLSTFGLEFMGSDIINNPVEAARRYRPLLADMLGSIGNLDLDHLFQNFSNDLADELAETEVGIMEESQALEPAQGLKGLLYYIAEEKAKREAYEHRGIRCDSCNESPIRGIRWHCLNCPDVDLCSTCEMTFPHQQTHVFVKVKIPLPAVAQPGRALNYPVWYPGSPHILHEPIQPALRKRLAEEYHHEEPQIDALYDQFITTANVSFEQDPSQIKIGIDRRAFDSALTIEAWTDYSAPNALYDRMFAFYDRGNKGAILFEDFINGMAYLRGPSRFQPLSRALQGFDIDADGYVDRRDFLLLLRAKYEVQKELIAGASSIRADKISQEGIDVLKSSQPISAVFCEQDMPQGELRSSGGKPRNVYGDLEPAEGTKTILDDDEVPAGASALPNNVFRVRSLPQLQRQLARLDRRLNQQETEIASAGGEAAVEEQTDSMPSTLSAEDAAALGVTSNPSTEQATASTQQDALWKFTEMSINEALDPIFISRERLDRDVEATSEERRRWRKEIDDLAEQKNAFEDYLRAGAELDPLVAAAAHSHDQISRSWITNQDTPEQRAAEVQREIDVQMRDSILPTDEASLDQFEAEIHEQSLEELLAAAGYSIAEDNDGDDDKRPASPAATENPPNQQNGSTTISTDEVRPQQDRLEYLATLDHEERLIETRGGAGRLSYEEVESMAKTNREVRGLVVSWLELASF
ncbi:hypothetical protein Q7P35_011201 [Cladosporium inversicolor]